MASFDFSLERHSKNAVLASVNNVTTYHGRLVLLAGYALRVTRAKPQRIACIRGSIYSFL